MRFFTLAKMAIIVGLLLGVNAHAEKTYTLKLAMTWGNSLPPFTDSVEKFAKMCDEMSGGRLKIKIDSVNKHKAAFGILDMVKAGQYDMGHTASYYYKGKDINMMFFTTTPFGMNALEQYGWFYYGGGMELMQKLYEKYGLMSFPGGNTGVQMGGWFRKEIKSADDLKGLKMRIPGFAGEVLSKLGVTVTNIAPGELYMALDRGTIDALEWVGPGMDISMGFHKVAPYYYTGWHEPATELNYVVNPKKFNSLPKDLQAILVNAMKLSAYDMFIQNYDMSANAWDAIAKEYPNIKIEMFPKDILDSLQKITNDLLDEYSKNDPLTKEIVDSQRAYLKKAREWSRMSEYYYLKSVVPEKAK